MCTSVPQIAVLRTLISTSLGPISGTGTCCIHMPGSAFAFTRARIMLDMQVSGIVRSAKSGFVEWQYSPSFDNPQVPADRHEGLDRAVDVFRRMRGRHLGAD